MNPGRRGKGGMIDPDKYLKLTDILMEEGMNKEKLKVRIEEIFAQMNGCMVEFSKSQNKLYLKNNKGETEIDLNTIEVVL